MLLENITNKQIFGQTLNTYQSFQLCYNFFFNGIDMGKHGNKYLGYLRTEKILNNKVGHKRKTQMNLCTISLFFFFLFFFIALGRELELFGGSPLGSSRLGAFLVYHLN